MFTPAHAKTSKSPADRAAFHYDLTGHLVSGAERRPIRCFATKVSRRSLHLVSLDALEPKSQVTLDLKGVELHLIVASCKLDGSRPGVFHIDLTAQLSQPDLSQSLTAEQVAEEHPDPIAARFVESPDPRYSFAKLKELIAAVTLHDPEALDQLGLSQSVQERRAYALDLEGQSLIVLLPFAMLPAQVVEMDESSAARSLVILARKRSVKGDSRWVKAWPIKALVV